MVGHDNFRRGGHAYGIAAGKLEEAQPGRRLEAWAGNVGINSLAQRHTGRGGYAVGQRPQLGVIGGGHVGEARPDSLIVRPAQRVGAGHAGEVQVIADDHQIAGCVSRVQPTGGIGDDERAQPQRHHDANRQGNAIHRIAFVEMGAPLQDEHCATLQLADDQPADVAGHGRYRPIGDVVRRDNIGVLDLIGQRIEAGAEDQPYFGLVAGMGTNEIGSGGDLLGSDKLAHSGFTGAPIARSRWGLSRLRCFPSECKSASSKYWRGPADVGYLRASNLY